MPRALIIGTGMLGSALLRSAPQYQFEAAAVSHAELDITDPVAVNEQILARRPDLIFHTAALTRVNYCEQHPEEAHAVNTLGTENILAAAERVLARIIYFSTDYVFDGQLSHPYRETDKPAPVNAYGASKLAGEQAVQRYHRGHIVRTSGVFGQRSDGSPERNFLRAIFCRYHGDDGPIHVVDNQYTALTYAPHLASMVLSLLHEQLPPLTHLVSQGQDSWHGWACRVFAALGLDQDRLKPVSALEFDSSTRRPAYSVLESEYAAARALMLMHPATLAAAEYSRQVLELLVTAPNA